MNMKHKGTKTIETKQLILRPFKAADAQVMFDNWASDDEVTKYLTWTTHTDVSVTQMVVDDWMSHYNEKDYYQYAITVKENGDEPVGGISVVQINDLIKNMEVGYCIGKKWWNKGIVTEAFNALIKFFFEEVGAEKVSARHDVDNPASGRVMQKCGLKFEGVIRRELLVKEKPRDLAHYSILKDEYFADKQVNYEA